LGLFLSTQKGILPGTPATEEGDAEDFESKGGATSAVQQKADGEDGEQKEGQGLDRVVCLQWKCRYGQLVGYRRLCVEKSESLDKCERTYRQVEAKCHNVPQ